MLDYGVFPPEINSGRMYAGPGPGSMLAAATAWDGLAAELRSAASSYGSVVSALTSGSWLGPSSALMAQAAAPYVAWMSSTAAQSEEAASQAKAAVAAYETAFAAMVPPPVIAANRAQLAALIATNFFGQNSPAIAATEAEYGEMWAQDAAAMYGYAGASSAATQMAPFISPAPTTSVAGLTQQAEALSNANGTPAGTAAQTAASTTTQLASATAVPQALQQLSSAAASTSASGSSSSSLSSLSNFLSQWSITGSNGWIAFLTSGSSWNAFTNYGYFPFGTMNSLFGFGAGLMPGAPAPNPALGGAIPPLAPWGAGVGNGPGAVYAGVGQAGTIGRLSVPASWAAASQQMIGAEAPGSTGSLGLLSTHAAAHVNPGTSGLLRGIPLTGAGAGRRAAGGFIHKYGFRHAVMPRPPSAG